MAWSPDEEYWGRKLGATRRAITLIEEKIPTLTEQRQIDAHQSYLAVMKRNLKTDEARYRAWRNKRQNTERSAK